MIGDCATEVRTDETGKMMNIHAECTAPYMLLGHGCIRAGPASEPGNG